MTIEPAVDTVVVPTLAHVAKLAGVSPATASRVINGSARVSHGARAQVEEAVRRLGYVRRTAAAPPTGRRRRSIAAVICEDSARFFSDPFFARVLNGVRRGLEGGPQLVVLMAGRAEDWRARAVPSGGAPPAARNITGSVVISSSSMTRGLVSAT